MTRQRTLAAGQPTLEADPRRLWDLVFYGIVIIQPIAA